VICPPAKPVNPKGEGDGVACCWNPNGDGDGDGDGAAPNASVDEDVPKAGFEEGVQNAGIEEGAPNAGVEEGVPKAGLEDGLPKAGVDDGAPNAGVEEGVPKAGVVEGVPKEDVEEGVPKRGGELGVPNMAADKLCLGFSRRDDSQKAVTGGGDVLARKMVGSPDRPGPKFPGQARPDHVSGPGLGLIFCPMLGPGHDFMLFTEAARPGARRALCDGPGLG
jgi:hypothetical protein